MSVKKIITSTNFLIGFYVGFVLTLCITGYIITYHFYPKELVGKEVYIDATRSKTCDKLEKY
jgi:hypothetical protein